MSGPASQTTKPANSPMLRSAMLEELQIKNLSIGAITGGPFTHGETITGGTSSATAKVFRDTANGAAVIKFHTVTGTFQSAETITGGTSGATATTSSTAADNGWMYRTTDSEFDGVDTDHHVTCGFNQDGQRIVSRGSLANLQMEFQVGRAAIVTQRFVGAKASHGDVALALPSSYPEESNAAPRFVASTLTLGGYTPNSIQSLSLNIETNPGLREDSQEADGIKFTDYEKIAPIISLDPAQDDYATWDVLASLAGGTTFAVGWKCGGTPGLIWEFFADEVQYTSVDQGSERTHAKTPIELRCNGTSTRSDIYIWVH